MDRVERLPEDLVGFLRTQLAAAQAVLSKGKAAGTWTPERIAMQIGRVERWDRWLKCALAANRGK